MPQVQNLRPFADEGGVVARHNLSRSAIAVACVLLACLAGLIVAVVSLLNTADRRTERLTVIEEIELAVRVDELATSTLDLTPILRDEDPIDEILEDIDDEAETIRSLLARVSINARARAEIETIVEQLGVVVGASSESIEGELALSWSSSLSEQASRIIADRSSWHSDALMTARNTASAHQSELSRRRIGLEADLSQSNLRLVDDIAALLAEMPEVAIDADSEIVWKIDAGSSIDELDDIGELVFSLSLELQEQTLNNEIGLSFIWVGLFGAMTLFGLVAVGVVARQSRGERSDTLARLRHAAGHDSLTGLFNRAELEEVVAHLGPIERGLVGLLFIDLDGFKAVNDDLGHHIGDELLKEVASRLRIEVRDGDLVARLGGDEFVVLLPSVLNPKDLLAVAERVVASIAMPVAIEGEAVLISASVGAASCGAREFDLTQLLRDADAALFVAKGRGKGCVVAAPQLTEALEAEVGSEI